MATKSKTKKSFGSTKVGKALSSFVNKGTYASKPSSKAAPIKSAPMQGPAKPTVYGPAKPAALKSPSVQKSTGSYKAAGSTPQYGTKGESVLALQKELNKKNAGQAGYTPLKEDSMYGPKTLAATKFKPSPTVISNENKINQIPEMNAQLDKFKDKGIRTDEQGNARYADGSFLQEQEADTKNEDRQIENYFRQLKGSLDASTQGQINNIEQKFAERKRQQEEINKRNEAANRNALLMGGVTGQGSSAQYAPVSSQGIMQAQETYGLQQIATLDSQEQDLIAQAVQAQEEGNFRIMEKKLELVQQKRKEKVDAAAKLNEQIAKRNLELQEQAMQIEKESAIADIYATGTTDTAEVLKQLRGSGVNATAKEVSDTIGLLSGIGGTGIVGEYNFYRSQAKQLGQVPVDFSTYQNIDANRKKSIASAGVGGTAGLNSKQTQNFLSITNKFQADAFINNAIKGQTAIAIADQVIADPNNAANQLKSLYTLVKNLDPDSAVREGEISLADKTQSYLASWGNSLSRINQGRVISPAAAVQLATATKELAQSWADTANRRKTQYQSQANISGIGDAFNEYLSTSNLGFGGELIQTGQQAQQSIDSFITNNPAESDMIANLYNNNFSDIQVYEYLQARGLIN